MFAVKFVCEEAVGDLGMIITPCGEEAWIIVDDYVLTSCVAENNDLPNNILKFGTEEEAHKLMKIWKGHPWYYKPSGKYSVIPIEPRFVQCGYKVKGDKE